MKRNHLVALTVIGLFILGSAFVPAGRWVSNKTHISFFSDTTVEDITANNYKAVSTMDPATGEVVFSVPMQSFEFEKSLMQKHFNGKDFLHTKAFPKAKLKGTITNLGSIDFTKPGTYPANIEGELTIKETTNKVKEKGTVTVNASGISVQSEFKVVLADYGITFSKGKPSTNIAKIVDVKVMAEYQEEK